MTFLRESSVVFRRQIRMNLRNPAWVLIGVMQPVLYLVLFGPLLKPLVGSFGVGAENAYTFLVPGLLVQLGLFGMPFRWIVDAVRDTFAGNFGTSHTFWGTVWAVVLFALAVWWGTATFRKENA